MDIATLIGIVGGFALIIVSILIGSPISAFINVPGLIVVIGGTVMATLIMQRMSVVLGAFKIAANVFFIRSDPPEKIIRRIVELTTRAKREGLLALEEEEIPNEFLARGVRMAVDGVPQEDIISSLEIDLSSQLRRHQSGQQIFRFMGSTAPAMGMIGTLIGLVQMLRTLNEPENIGPAMAVALLTTFYGAVLAFLLFIPIAEKLRDRTTQERITKEVIIEGMRGITEGSNPRLLEDKLFSFVAPAKRGVEEEEEKTEAEEEGEKEAA